MKPPLQHAGGYRVADGCLAYPNSTPAERQPWIEAVHQRLSTATDWATYVMLHEATGRWSTFEPVAYHRIAQLNPRGKAEALVAHILRQGRFKPVDILAAGLGALLCVEYDPRLKRPPRIPYYRAVQVGVSVRRLHKLETKLYTRETALGVVEEKVVVSRYLSRVRSRYMCQRLEALVRKVGEDFLRREGPTIATQILANSRTWS
jgi:hypothetical protein